MNCNSRGVVSGEVDGLDIVPLGRTSSWHVGR